MIYAAIIGVVALVMLAMGWNDAAKAVETTQFEMLAQRIHNEPLPPFARFLLCDEL